MTTDLMLVVDNRPGALADVAEAMGRVGVNIEGICCFVSQGIAMVHVAVEHAGSARKELEHIGLKVYEAREVVVFDLEDSPGAAADVLRRIGNAGVSLDMAYLATGTRMVIAADDLDKVRAVLS
ncbi:MAG TPA: amino acid-binding protein [Chloroflexota bacterium]|jgi:hypothetical protein|nr:amino acid-binding protein [Chloroflexota bacterium]